VIDLGAGTSDFVLYRHGGPHTTGVLAVGGDHLSNDLSVALRLTVSQAEKLKLRYGRALVQARDRQEQVWLDGTKAFGDRPFLRHSIEQITAARTRELLEVVRKKLGQAFAPETCAAGVVLTGGSAKLPGIAECAAQVFGISARLGEVDRGIVANLREPVYHTALGVLYEGVHGEVDRGSSAPRRSGLLHHVTRLFGSA
jgi:cell division protein FtsA